MSPFHFLLAALFLYLFSVSSLSAREIDVSVQVSIDDDSPLQAHRPNAHYYAQPHDESSDVELNSAAGTVPAPVVRKPRSGVSRHSPRRAVPSAAASAGSLTLGGLQSGALPNSYDIHFILPIDSTTFDGTVLVDFTLSQPMKSIEMNSKDLTLKHAWLKDGTESSVALKFREFTDREAVRFEFPSVLDSGSHRIQVEFSGSLSKNMLGIYRQLDDLKQTVILTMMDPAATRFAFPCFDEPNMKATFKLTIETTAGYQVFSNAEKVKESDGSKSGLVKHSFAATPKMSSYLVAFVIGKFETIEAKTSRGVTVRVSGSKSVKLRGQYALDQTIRILEYYESYFNIPYPLNKLDMMPVYDFNYGAMENFGCIIYMAQNLLLDESDVVAPSDPKEAAALAVKVEEKKKEITRVIVHELAHQWFGNLATYNWWDEVWLNEAFCRFLEYYIVEKLHPEWNVFQTFASSRLIEAFDADSLSSAHPLKRTVTIPRNVDLFDSITYEKGAVVVKMMYDLLGEKSFQLGVSQYIRQYQYRNAVARDLWNALNSVNNGNNNNNGNVRTLIEGWTNIQGYPTVQATLKGNQIVLTQKKFQYLPMKSSSGIVNPLWKIPIDFKCGTTEQWSQRVIMQHRKMSIPIPSQFNCTGDGFYMLNIHHNAMYRTLYDENNFASLMLAVEGRNPILTPDDQLFILNDAFAFNRARQLAPARLIKALQAYSKGASTSALSALVDSLSYFVRLAPADSPLGESTVAKWIYKTFSNVAKTESAFERLFKTFRIESHIQSLLTNTKDDSARSVYRAILGGDQVCQELLVQYKQFHDQQKTEEQINILTALLSSQSTSCFERSLPLIYDFPGGTGTSILRSAMRNPLAVHAFWRFFQAEWSSKLQAHFAGYHNQVIPRLRILCSSDAADQLVRLTARDPAALSVAKQIAEEINTCAQWKNLYQSQFIQLFQQ